MSAQTNHPILESFFPVVDCFSEFLGSSCEVALYDLSNLQHSVVKIRNGHVTGQKAGDPMPEIGREIIKDIHKGLKVIGNYNHRTKSGRLLKCNAAIIRDEKGNPAGILCISYDVSRIQQIEQMMKDFYNYEQTSFPIEENFGGDLWSYMRGMIELAIKEKQKPVHLLVKEDRIEIIRYLHRKGLFYAKGSIPQVANALGISPPSIYKYLEEIRSFKE